MIEQALRVRRQGVGNSLIGEEQKRLVVWNRADRMMASQEAKMQVCSSIGDSEMSLHNDEREWVRTLAVRTQEPDIYPHG